MVVLRLRSESEHDELLRKLKKMYKFTKDLMEKVEDCCEMEEEYEDEYEENYREHDDHDKLARRDRGTYRRGRYRRNM